LNIVDSNTFFGFSPREKVDYSLDALEGMLKKNSVAQAMSLSLRGVSFDFQEGNDETLAASKQRPWLIPCATIDPRRHLGCLEEIHRMREAGVKAFRFFPDVQGWPVDFLPMRNLLVEIDRLGGIAFVPAGENGMGTRTLSILDGLLVPTILVGATYVSLGEAIACLQSSPNLYLDTQQLVTPMALEVLTQEVGVDRVIFGSRAPERSLRAAIRMVADSSLSESDKAKVFSGNVLHLLEAVA
jgi:predicted TIM-barrel fold metal-dependent hydrolase